MFFRSLKDKTADDDGKKLDVHISDEDYLACKKIWDKFNMKNMGDYHDGYLKKDVLLLADVFEKFIDTCLKFYELDPCHYFSSPGLSWDSKRFYEKILSEQKAPKRKRNNFHLLRSLCAQKTVAFVVFCSLIFCFVG